MLGYLSPDSEGEHLCEDKYCSTVVSI
jgi:hypothetical protein